MGARTLETSIPRRAAESSGKPGVDPRERPCPMCSTTARAEKNPTHSGATLRQDPTGSPVLPALRRRAPPHHTDPGPRSWWERRNAPTGAWCSLTEEQELLLSFRVLVSMHLQVRGAP